MFSCVCVLYPSLTCLSFRFFLPTVGITWEDAPTEQSAIFGQPYKVRCVVRANPPATIDWQKNGVGFTTSKSSSSFTTKAKKERKKEKRKMANICGRLTAAHRVTINRLILREKVTSIGAAIDWCASPG